MKQQVESPKDAKRALICSELVGAICIIGSFYYAFTTEKETRAATIDSEAVTGLGMIDGIIFLVPFVFGVMLSVFSILSYLRWKSEYSKRNIQ